MSHGHTRWAIAKTARQRNLLWTLPAVIFFLLGLGFLVVFAINYVGGLLDGGHYLLLVISSAASPFLTLGIFSLILGGIFKLCGYLASLSYIKLYERAPIVPASQSAATPPEQDEPPQTPVTPNADDADAPQPDPGPDDL